METKLYKIRAGFARREKWLIYFVAIQVRETAKAVYLYGRGTTETTRMGVCCNCGRTLTHPVSVELGIGPECGQHFHNWDLIGGYNKENLERLRGALADITVEGWIPKSVIVETFETDEVITLPKDHKMLKQNDNQKNDGPRAKIGKTKSGESRIRLDFPYSAEMVAQVKTLPGRKFHPEHKCWSIPSSRTALLKLEELGFSMCPDLQKYLDRYHAAESTTTQQLEIPGLKKELYPYQKDGVRFIEQHNGRALIGDEMGLGKTIQAIAWLQLHPDFRPAIIVVPASLKLNWKREIEAWMPNPQVLVLEGREVRKIPTSVRIIIINYDILADWLETLLKTKPSVVITDESQYFKTNGAKRTKAVKKLARGVDNIIILTGTPIVNRPIEIFNAISILDSGIFPSRWDFAHKYCGARHNGFGWDFNGATNTLELHSILTKEVMIRRLKKDVLKDLPEKSRTHLPLPLTNRGEYDRAEADFIDYIQTTRGTEAVTRAANAEALTRIEMLKQLAFKGKMKHVINWVEDFLETGEKLILFGIHREAIDTIMQRFGEVAVKVDGSVSGTDRDRAVQRFQTDPNVRLFVGNIKAAGVGLTLTAASNVAFMELPWTPGDLIQAEDRAHRIGQRFNVTIHYLLSNNTIEERIASLIDHKRQILDQVLDGQDTTEENLLTELIDSYANR